MSAGNDDVLRLWTAAKRDQKPPAAVSEALFGGPKCYNAWQLMTNPAYGDKRIAAWQLAKFATLVQTHDRALADALNSPDPTVALTVFVPWGPALSAGFPAGSGPADTVAWSRALRRHVVPARLALADVPAEKEVLRKGADTFPTYGATGQDAQQLRLQRLPGKLLDTDRLRANGLEMKVLGSFATTNGYLHVVEKLFPDATLGYGSRPLPGNEPPYQALPDPSSWQKGEYGVIPV